VGEKGRFTVDMDSIITYSGIASVGLHLIQGATTLFKHFKMRSKCCGAVSELEIDSGSPIEKKKQATIDVAPTGLDK
jgi:hypothetical protein